ncbi:unnamed protein product [marine sediment metagenome]|uniref:Uncharacterized protein n=1 Tax=marine sediment metagenome TaxID=412755 RepID=X1DW82_9ZZZZ
MLDIFGIGTEGLPPEAFSTKGFHCGFMTTDKSQAFFKLLYRYDNCYFIAKSLNLKKKDSRIVLSFMN